MWPDNETTVDLLGFRVHADLVRSVVTDRNLLPVTIGLYGDWGGGKTSVMKMLERDLDPESWPDTSTERKEYADIAVLYFNGWLFEGYDDAKAAILEAVLQSLIEHKRFGPKIREKATSLIKSVNWMRLAKLGLTAGAGALAGPAGAYAATLIAQSPLLQKSADALAPVAQSMRNATSESSDPVLGKDENEADAEPGVDTDVRTFRHRFAKMLKDSDIGRLVVLIDDLDRCSPERIIENLEAVKLFLNVENTAFVIGADRRIIRHAIEWRYQQSGGIPVENDDAEDRLVEDYLEKLIQIPYRLPRLSPAETETYLTLLYCGLFLQKDDGKVCLAACEDARRANRFRVFGFGDVRQVIKKLPDSLTAALTFCAAASPLIHQALKGNPRQIKRFLNAVALRKRLADVASLAHQDDVLVKLMALEYAKPLLFAQLYDWQGAQDGRPEQIAMLEEALRPPKGNQSNEKAAAKIAAGWDDSLARRWIVADPPLADVDLRDYFWLARDTLQTTLSGVTMVPPIVRRTLEELLSKNPAARSPAAKAATSLEADERALLLNLLQKHTARKPSEPATYEAFNSLVVGEVHGSAEALHSLLKSIPLDDVPASVGINLYTLQRTLKTRNAALDATIDFLAQTDSRAGQALKTIREKK